MSVGRSQVPAQHCTAAILSDAQLHMRLAQDPSEELPPASLALWLVPVSLTAEHAFSVVLCRRTVSPFDISDVPALQPNGTVCLVLPHQLRVGVVKLQVACRYCSIVRAFEFVVFTVWQSQE